MSASKNNAFNRLPQFIWGEAVDESKEDGFSRFEFLTHTRYPRFVCAVAENVTTATGSAMQTELESAVGFMPDGREIYSCVTHGVAFSNFVWLDPRPDPSVLKSACDKAVLNRLIRDDFMGLNDGDT